MTWSASSTRRVADLTTIGAYAEYMCLPENRLTPVPAGVSDVDALGMILSAVTPFQMLHRVAKMRAGQSLLVHGAGGAVGTAMLQLARDAGIAAFGTDAPAKHDLQRQPVPLTPCAQAGRHARGLRLPERGARARRVHPDGCRQAHALGLAAEWPRDGLLFHRRDAPETPRLVPR